MQLDAKGLSSTPDYHVGETQSHNVCGLHLKLGRHKHTTRKSLKKELSFSSRITGLPCDVLPLTFSKGKIFAKK